MLRISVGVLWHSQFFFSFIMHKHWDINRNEKIYFYFHSESELLVINFPVINWSYLLLLIFLGFFFGRSRNMLRIFVRCTHIFTTFHILLCAQAKMFSSLNMLLCYFITKMCFSFLPFSAHTNTNVRRREMTRSFRPCPSGNVFSSRVDEISIATKTKSDDDDEQSSIKT